MQLTVGSLFSGIGGIDFAFEQAGFDIAWQVEIDTYCQEVLAKNFPNANRYLDIQDQPQLPHVDVVVAGFPCQPFSQAGKRLGKSDKRFLIPDMLNVIKEVDPYVVFLENVPNFANLNNGAEFKGLLEWFAKNGYDAQWQHTRANHFGAPHRRERWFCVAYKKELGDTYCQCDQRDGSLWDDTSQERLRSLQSTGTGNRTGREHKVKPRLGRTVDGVLSGLDRHKFPASRGKPQYEYESPRVTYRTEHRGKRIKALGNAVVPQTVYPVALAIRLFLRRGLSVS